jgi:hypothetical protein
MSWAVCTRLPAIRLLIANGTTPCRASCARTINILRKTLAFIYYDDKLAHTLSWTKSLDAEIFPIKKPRCISYNGVLRSLKTLTGKCQR